MPTVFHGVWDVLRASFISFDGVHCAKYSLQKDRRHASLRPHSHSSPGSFHSLAHFSSVRAKFLVLTDFGVCPLVELSSSEESTIEGSKVLSIESSDVVRELRID